jgi:hypothetical protein
MVLMAYLNTPHYYYLFNNTRILIFVNKLFKINYVALFLNLGVFASCCACDIR